MISLSCRFHFSHSLVMMVYLCSQLCNLCPWIPSSLGAIYRSHNRIRLRRWYCGSPWCLVLTGTDTTAVVVSLSVCSRRSSAECFFDSLELDELSAPDLRHQGSSSSHGSCAESGSTGEFVVSRGGVNAGSGRVGEHETSCLVVAPPDSTVPKFKKSESDTDHWAENFPAFAL